MFGILIIAALLGWLINRARTQRLAVAAILQAGGLVEYDTVTPSASMPPALSGPGGRPTPPAPRGSSRINRWLRAQFGHDFFDTVTEARLLNSPIDDALLRQVGSLPRLKLLQIKFGDYQSTPLSRDGFPQLANLSDLREVMISGKPSIDGLLPYLSGLTQIRRLEIHATRPSDQDLLRLENLIHLESVDLDATRLTDKIFSVVENWKRLKYLRMENCQFSDISPLQKHPDLRIVELTRPKHAAPNFGRSSLEPFRNNSKLEQLYMIGFQLDRSGIEPILNLPGLAVLAVEGQTITDADLARLAQKPGMIRLDLYHAAVSSLEPLTPLIPSLGCLKFVDAPLTDAGVACLKDARQLSFLDLSGSRISDVALSHLAALPQVATLHLRDTAITDAGIGSLKAWPLLQFELDLSGTKTTDAGVAQIVAQWPGIH